VSIHPCAEGQAARKKCLDEFRNPKKYHDMKGEAPTDCPEHCPWQYMTAEQIRAAVLPLDHRLVDRTVKHN
jgi:hypothetical protein